ncbi:hypothetical protein BGV91_gp39 [Haloarcula californiae icosahedral virus 1]|uniref:Uncharacterized protein n=1 Tax=Haloarcula californiae icosahedral virus 1 TaxID=1735722 RepID=A0A1C7A3S8_9VIRU|nr:hypothetical protein BGV91_gp39 [Haloarcula californiae icosahedral virus 1]ALJ99702.1 hypothetical protein SS136_039 [Haloarcula californiae icosahedral virus 1]
MTQDRDPKVSYRMPQERLEAIDDLAEQHGVARSALLRRFDAFGLESNAEALGVEAEIANLRQEIIDFGKPIDDAGGFAGRVRDDFEKRFKSGYKPKWLAAKAESYRREAEMLEEKVADHPDAPPIEEGELVDEVNRVLRDTLEAAQLSDWTERYSNPLERLSGVESGKQSRRFALVLTRNALEMDQDLEPLNSTLGTERRVRRDDLPELAEEDLPPNVDRDDVARVARDLADRGVTADDVEVDPTEFDPFGWIDVDSEVVDDDDVVAVEGSTNGELPDPEADGGTESVVADGGDNEAIQVYAEQDDERDVGDLVEWAAQALRDCRNPPKDAFTDRKNERRRKQGRKAGERRIRQTFETDTGNWQTEIMDQSTLTPDDVIEAAHDYNEQRDAAFAGERDSAPEAVATANGGVRLE